MDSGDIGSGTFAVCKKSVCRLLGCIESTTEELLNGVKELACGMEGKALLRESNKSLKEFSMWTQESCIKLGGTTLLLDEGRGQRGGPTA